MKKEIETESIRMMNELEPINPTQFSFKSYCSRMWLDYCDENNDPISAPNRWQNRNYREDVNINSK